MIKLKTERVCNKCSEPAKIWHNKQWWCATESSMGSYAIVGICVQEKKK